MMRGFEPVFGRPDMGVDLTSVLRNALATKRSGTPRLRAGFAYATRSGAVPLLASLAGDAQWSTTTKSWLIGVHQAISEPAAMQALADLPNSHVRLAVCGESLPNAILGRRMFHAKLLAIDWGSDHTISTLFTGSANLTAAATGVRCRNYEAGGVWHDGLAPKDSRKLKAWWDAAWSESVPLNARILETYVKLRERFHRDNPDVIAGGTVPTAGDLSEAQVLWIDAGLMSGQDRNQVEFSEELAAFFGPVVGHRQLLTMVRGRQVWDDRPLSPKVTTLGVGIWRLSLPTSVQSGLRYPGRMIRLEKQYTPGGTRFKVDVADADSHKAQSWREEAHRNGVVARTGGGRHYGFL